MVASGSSFFRGFLQRACLTKRGCWGNKTIFSNNLPTAQGNFHWRHIIRFLPKPSQKPQKSRLYSLAQHHVSPTCPWRLLPFAPSCPTRPSPLSWARISAIPAIGAGPVNGTVCPGLSQNRLWRKNKSSQPGISCIGVDLNRNWRTGFGGMAICSMQDLRRRGWSTVGSLIPSEWVESQIWSYGQHHWLIYVQ